MLSKGLAFENIALKYLQNHQLRLIERNFRTRCGEIDLIMKDGSTLTFIEVRYRKSTTHGSSSESVTPTKQKKIIKSAQIYLMKKNLWHLNSRFDVVAISPKIPPTTQASFKHEIHWHKAAFTC